MARKKHLENIDEYEMGFIDAKARELVKIDNKEYFNVSLKSLPYKIEIKCKNKKQKDFLNLLRNKEKQIVVGSGAAGSGKSWITYAHALSLLRSEDSGIEQIVVFIPCAQAGSKEISLGYLKGDLNDKTRPFCEASIYTMEQILKESGNVNYKMVVNDLINSGRITFNFLNFSRGKTFNNSCVILEESENISSNEMILLLSRIGFGSQYICIGDEIQKDRKDIKNEDSGMIKAINNLKDLDEFGYIEFTNEDIVRNPLITKILDNWK